MGRAIRGATCAENTKESILASTREMLVELMERNDVQNEDIESILFTCTKDLTKVYPAVAAREIGITQAGLMCMQELFVEGSLEKCIRVLVQVSSGKQSQAQHVYLKEATRLRPDLAK